MEKIATKPLKMNRIRSVCAKSNSKILVGVRNNRLLIDKPEIGSSIHQIVLKLNIGYLIGNSI